MTMQLHSNKLYKGEEIQRTTNWSKFKREFTVENFPINNTYELEKAVEQLENQINTATENSTTTKQRHHKYNLPQNIQELIKTKTRQRKNTPALCTHKTRQP